MEHDLALLETHQAKREQEASTEERLGSADSDAKPSGHTHHVGDQVTEAVQTSREDTDAVDVIMTDHPVKSEVTDHQVGTTSESALKAETPAIKEEQPPDPQPTNQSDLLNDLPAGNNEDFAQVQPGTADAAEKAVNVEVPLLDETEGLSDAKDINFESMFDDAVGNGNNDEIDFGLDFSNDAGNAQALLDDDPFSTGVSIGDVPAVAAATTEDIDSLLPGLESFANATGDFSMIDMPPASATVEAAVTTAPDTRPATTTADVPTDLLPPESNFDDMFFDSADFTMGDGNGGGSGGDDVFGEIGDFDESWFKTDSI